MRACEVEKRKTLLENRLIQQVRASHPKAEIQTVEVARVTEERAPDESVSQSDSEVPITYASVVASRAIHVDTADGREFNVHLPGPTPIPRAVVKSNDKPKVTKKIRAVVNRRFKKVAAPTGGTSRRTALGLKLDSPKTLRPIIRLLDAFCPKASRCLKQLIQALGPVLKLAGTIKT